MRKETKEFTIYTIEELTGEAYTRAIQDVQEDKLHAFNEWTSNEFAESVSKFLEKMGCSHGDMYLDVYDHGRSYIEVLTGNYFEQTNQERNELVSWLNDNIQAGSEGSCPFTGVFTDCFVFDYFIKEDRGTSYNTLHKDIREAVDYALEAFLDSELEDITDELECECYANDMGFEYLENGERYIG